MHGVGDSCCCIVCWIFVKQCFGYAIRRRVQATGAARLLLVVSGRLSVGGRMRSLFGLLELKMETVSAIFIFSGQFYVSLSSPSVKNRFRAKGAPSLMVTWQVDKDAFLLSSS